MTSFERIAAALAPHYRVERELGHGAIGTVFLATSDEGARAAIKVLSADLVALMRDTAAFVDAMRLASRLQHPSIMPLLGAGASGAGDIYYAMAYQPGDTARDRLDRDGPLPASEVARIGAEACDALALAHAEGLTHGTLAPGNLHVMSDGRVRVADIGLRAALVVAGIDPERLNEIMGAPQYMSPEQLEGRSVDARSDVYSLGAALYELLTGKPPFGGRTTSYVIAAVLAEEPAAPEGDPLTKRVTDTVLRAIEKAPEDRWPSAAAFARALRSEERPGTPVAAPTVETSPAARAGCVPVVAAAVLGAGATVGLAVLF